MTDCKLEKVHELISFQNLFESDNEYISELAYIHHGDLGTEAIYSIEADTSVLFTTKLRYYAKKTEATINNYIDGYSKLLVDKDSCLVKYVLKVTREAAETLIRLAKDNLCRCDADDKHWDSVRSDNMRYDVHLKPTIEYVVYMHDLIAELVRFRLEMQDRYADVTGTECSYDVSLIYSSLLNRRPDKEFEVKKIERKETVKKGPKTIKTDCCFFFDAGDEQAAAVQEFRNKLVKLKLLSEETDCKDMMSLLSGRPCRKTFKWIGEKHYLKWIIKGLIDNHIISTWPKGTSPWDVVSCRFVDKDGNLMTNDIRTESSRKTAKPMYDEVIDTLKGYI